MRGIIIEKKWHSAIVMTNNGQFRRLYFPFGKEVADEVVLQRQPRMQFAVAAMAVFFLVAGLVGYNTRFQSAAYGFVSIEVNPAAEFQINQYGVVVEAVPLNTDAEAILSEISYRWRAIERVAADYVAQALAAGLIDNPEEARILVTISGIEGADMEALERRLAAIETAQRQRLAQMNVTAETDYRQVTPEVRQEAATLGVATGTWERLQRGAEIAYTVFDLEIESGDDDKLEVEYRQETHGFTAEVEWELGSTEWEREGSRALEYLLPILRRLELRSGMSQDDVMQRVVTAFEWPGQVDEFSLTAVLTDGSRISFEWDREDTAPPSTPQPIPVEDDDDDDDEWDDDDEDDNDGISAAPSSEQAPATTLSTPVIVYFDLEVDGDDDTELDVEYEVSSGGSVSADIEFEQNDRTIADLEDQAAVNYLVPILDRLNLQPGMSRQQVMDRVLAAFGWRGGYEDFEIEVVFDTGERISFKID